LIVQALAPSVLWLLIGRVLCGSSCGTQAVALAYVADVTPRTSVLEHSEC